MGLGVAEAGSCEASQHSAAVWASTCQHLHKPSAFYWSSCLAQPAWTPAVPIFSGMPLVGPEALPLELQGATDATPNWSK